MRERGELHEREREGNSMREREGNSMVRVSVRVRVRVSVSARVRVCNHTSWSTFVVGDAAASNPIICSFPCTESSGNRATHVPTEDCVKNGAASSP